MADLELCTQLTRTDGKWLFTGHATMRTLEACDAVIKVLEIIKPLLAENAAPDDQRTNREAGG